MSVDYICNFLNVLPFEILFFLPGTELGSKNTENPGDSFPCKSAKENNGHFIFVFFPCLKKVLKNKDISS